MPPAVTVSGLGNAEILASWVGSVHDRPGIMPLLCRKSPKWESLTVITMRDAASNRSWRRRMSTWLASTLTANVASNPFRALRHVVGEQHAGVSDRLRSRGSSPLSSLAATSSAASRTPPSASRSVGIDVTE